MRASAAMFPSLQTTPEYRVLDSSASGALLRYRCHPRLSYRHHVVRLAFPILAEVAQRLFPRRPERALVGDQFLHRVRRNEYSDRHRYARARIQRKLWLSPGGPRISSRPNHYLDFVPATVLPR